MRVKKRFAPSILKGFEYANSPTKLILRPQSSSSASSYSSADLRRKLFGVCGPLGFILYSCPVFWRAGAVLPQCRSVSSESASPHELPALTRESFACAVAVSSCLMLSIAYSSITALISRASLGSILATKTYQMKSLCL